ncbi:MAG TPA: DUF58 domain-containing protein [Nocardioidaceae bacterium]|nr:DUF58 domain-containing protein [Nocardioidaceae bacterium]
MREALSALTNRGRAFLAAGAAAILCAIALGYPALTRVGGLLLLLPLVTAFFVGRGRYRLGLVRTLSPGQVTAGQQARVQLELTNDGRMPTGLLMLEEHIPYVLGTRPRFVINHMGPKWRRTVEYVVRSDVRGKFVVGPMTVRLSDPFGLVELDRAFVATSSLVVTPKVTPLPAIPLSGAWTGAGDNRPRAFAAGSAEDVTVREYRQGDELRRVHWRSSAKAGELMVRREEPWQSRATLFLDNRTTSHRGTGAASSLEHAVAVAASVAVHLVQRGFRVRLVTATGEEDGGAWHEHGAMTAETAPLLESLAVLREVAQSSLDVRWLHEAGHSGLLVGVFGALQDRDKPAITRMKHSSATALAIALNVDAWARTRAPETAESDAAAWLASHGYRTVDCGPRDPVAGVWQELGHTRSGRRTLLATGERP